MLSLSERRGVCRRRTADRILPSWSAGREKGTSEGQATYFLLGSSSRCCSLKGQDEHCVSTSGGHGCATCLQFGLCITCNAMFLYK